MTQETYDIIMEAIQKENEAIWASPTLAKKFLKESCLEDILVYVPPKKAARKKRMTAAAKKSRKK